MSSIPMYFPPATFKLEDAVVCGELVNTAYDMYTQWKKQNHPDKSHFQWVPNGPAMHYSLPIWGSEKFLWFFTRQEPFAFVSWKDEGPAWLVFRGTESLNDWIQDSEAGQTPYTLVPNYGAVHHGFLKLYSSMSQAVIQTLGGIGARKALYIAGHSLGSGLSTLAVPDVIAHTAYHPGGVPVFQYNLASPRVGDSSFVGAYNANGVPTFRIVNTCDLVPAIPPAVLHNTLYEHVGFPVDFTAQYGSLAGNHSSSDSYLYALQHPNQPQGPTAT